MEDLASLQSLNRSVVVQMDLKFPLWGIPTPNIFAGGETCMVALNTLASTNQLIRLLVLKYDQNKTDDSDNTSKSF